MNYEDPQTQLVILAGLWIVTEVCKLFSTRKRNAQVSETLFAHKAHLHTVSQTIDHIKANVGAEADNVAAAEHHARSAAEQAAVAQLKADSAEGALQHQMAATSAVVNTSIRVLEKTCRGLRRDVNHLLEQAASTKPNGPIYPRPTPPANETLTETPPPSEDTHFGDIPK